VRAGTAEAEDHTALRAAIEELAAHLGRDPGNLSLGEIALGPLDGQGEHALEDEVDLFLAGVAVDPAALPGCSVIRLMPKL
jgi:hypothetical protein